jgi:hypothetical protein
MRSLLWSYIWSCRFPRVSGHSNTQLIIDLEGVLPILFRRADLFCLRGALKKSAKTYGRGVLLEANPRKHGIEWAPDLTKGAPCSQSRS